MRGSTCLENETFIISFFFFHPPFNIEQDAHLSSIFDFNKVSVERLPLPCLQNNVISATRHVDNVHCKPTVCFPSTPYFKQNRWFEIGFRFFIFSSLSLSLPVSWSTSKFVSFMRCPPYLTQGSHMNVQETCPAYTAILL